MTDSTDRPELAHYHTAWIWPEQSMEWIKALLLYFDGVALFLPQHHCDKILDADPVLAQPLWADGLLHNFDPRSWLKTATAKQIRNAAHEAVRNGWSSHAPGMRSIHHMAAPTEDVDVVAKKLLTWGVVTKRRPDLGPDMVQMDSVIRGVVLTTVALTARAVIHDYDIQPVADYSLESVNGLARSLPAFGMPKRRHLFAIPERLNIHTSRGWKLDRSLRARAVGLTLTADIEDCGIDLTGVPLDEVLDYRRQHGDQYRAYAHALRDFARDLASATRDDQATMLKDRTQEIADYAAALRQARRSFARPASAFALSAVGAAWTLRQGDPAGAVLAGLAAAAGFASPERPSSAYAYLFSAKALAATR